ncbi:MAG: hypothetical protein ACRD7E_02510 [Bryobacteraceae bacterium]
MRRQLRNSSDLDRERALEDGFRQGDYEPGWGLSIAGKPIEHARVGIVAVRFPGRAVYRMVLPVRMGEALSVLVMGITCVPVLERRLGEGEQQAR